MSEEKIINDEVMSEEELDEVAGGYGWEIRDDKKRLAGMGLLPSANASDKDLVKAFRKIGVRVETYHGDWTANEYKVNGRKMDHEQVWNYIYSHR